MKTPRRFGIIASILPKNLQELVKAIAHANGADTIEVRLDLIMPGLNGEFTNILSTSKKPTILTMDPRVPVNKWTDATLQERWACWEKLPKGIKALVSDKSREIFVDMGYELIIFSAKEHRSPIFPWEKIGVSFHDFDKTPDERPLDLQLYAMRLTQSQAFIKIVTMAKGEKDLRTIQRLLKSDSDRRLRDTKDQRPLIAFPIGPFGAQGRIECLSWGSAATYGYVPGFAPTAPGQLSIVELRDNPTVAMALRR